MRRLILWALLVASIGFFSGPLSAQFGYDGLFRSRETYIRNNANFTKWTGMLDRFMEEERKKYPEAKPTQEGGAAPDESPKDYLACPVKTQQSCRENFWEDFIKTVSAQTGVEQLDAVNRFLNQTPYIVDSVNWGVEDYWETLGEFFQKNGDCEDYAISKYVTLKKLGWAADSMRIAVINDENLRIPHAVLVVEHDNKRHILDNQANAILTDDKIYHYRPVYSINETGWWRHLPQRLGQRFFR